MLGKRRHNNHKNPGKSGQNGKPQLDQINKKKKMETQKKKNEVEYDDISSDNISMQDERMVGDEDEDFQFNNINSEDLDEETADQKRLRLAHQLLNNAKSQSKQKRINDDFFQLEDKLDHKSDQEDEDANLDELYNKANPKDDDDKDSYQAIDRDDEFDHVTKTLQENLLKKKNMIYNLYADSISEKYKQGNMKQIQLKGHKKTITSIQFDPNKKFLYSASKDSSIIKWDIERQQKIFISLGKNKHKQGHYDEILSMSVNFDGKYLVTAGKDRMIKLWDTQQEKLIDTFKGHKDTINAVKFGLNSNTFCTASCDRSFKLWDASERAFMDTLYGHKCDINAVDACSADNFISTGYDRQAIYWKTEHSTQLIFSGHEQSIDCVKGVTGDNFVTGGQDGQISLWNVKKKKPITTQFNAHGQNKWVTALGNSFNTDVLCSGSYNNSLNMYKIELNKRSLTKMFEIPCQGIVNDIQFSHDCQMMAYTQGEEHRLGRWITQNKIKNAINLILF